MLKATGIPQHIPRYGMLKGRNEALPDESPAISQGHLNVGVKPTKGEDYPGG